MNQFQYTIKLEAIKSMKTFKALKEVIVELDASISAVTTGYPSITGDNIAEVKLLFKCLSLAMVNYKASTTVGVHLTDRYIRLQTSLVKRYLNNYTTTTAADFIDTFQYMEIVDLGYSVDTAKLTRLDYILKDVSLPFEINYRFNRNPKFEHLIKSTGYVPVGNITNGNLDISHLVEIQHHAKLITAYKSTIYTDILGKVYAAMTPELSAELTENIAEMQSLKETFQIIKARTNG